MLDANEDTARIEVWLDMANHFLDTETRQAIPLTALCCLKAGLSVAAAREVWCFEVSPVVSCNLWNVAGVWEGWDREELLAEIVRARGKWRNRSWARWPRYWARLPIAHAYWTAIGRCMEVLLRFPEAERSRVAGALAWLAGHYFDYPLADDPTLPDDVLQCRAALYPEPFTSALMPAIFLGEASAAKKRVRAALQGDASWQPAATELWSHFAEALQRVGAAGHGRALFDELVARYGEAQRHYHTLKHIAECLGWLATHASLAQRPAEIALALWFHDAVYDPRASDNEARSAELARERLAALGVGTEVTERIAAQILATREHLAAGDADTQLLLDIDLSILGASPERFNDFEQHIRNEYAQVAPTAFQLGRQRVLRRLLEREHVYTVPALRRQLEAQARVNLERRIGELASWGIESPVAQDVV